jgi:hypothetical protein
MSDESNNKKQDFWVELSFIMLCGLVLLILFSMALGFRDSETVYVFEDTTYILDELHKEESFTYEPEQDRIKLKLLDDENCLVKRSFDNVKVYIIKDKSKPKIHILQQKQLSTLEKFLLKKYGKAPDRYIFASIITKLYVKSLDDVLCVRSIDDVRSALY